MRVTPVSLNRVENSSFLQTAPVANKNSWKYEREVNFGSGEQVKVKPNSMPRRAFLKNALIGLGVIAVTPSVLAQTAARPTTIKFGDISASIDGGAKKLTLFAVNTEGDSSGFNKIGGYIQDYAANTKKNGVVGGVLDVPERNIERFLFYDMKMTEILADVDERPLIQWVKNFINGNVVIDGKKIANKSQIVVEKTLKGSQKEKAKGVNSYIVTKTLTIPNAETR